MTDIKDLILIFINNNNYKLYSKNADLVIRKNGNFVVILRNCRSTHMDIEKFNNIILELIWLLGAEDIELREVSHEN